VHRILSAFQGLWQGAQRLLERILKFP